MAGKIGSPAWWTGNARKMLCILLAALVLVSGGILYWVAAGDSSTRQVTLGNGWTDNNDGTYSYDGSGGGILAFPEIQTEAADWDIYDFSATVTVTGASPAGWTGFGPMLMNDGEKSIYFRSQYGGGGYVMYTKSGVGETEIGLGIMSLPAQAVGTAYPVRVIVQKSTRRVQYYFDNTLVCDKTIPEVEGLIAGGEAFSQAVAAIKTISCGTLKVSDVAWRQRSYFPGEGLDVSLGEGWTDNKNGTYQYDGREGGGVLSFPEIATDVADWDIYEFTADIQTTTVRGAGWTGFGPMLLNNSDGEIYFRTQDGGGCYMMHTKNGGAEQEVSGIGQMNVAAQTAGAIYPIRLVVQKSTRRVQYYFNGALLCDKTVPAIDGLLGADAPFAEAIAAIKVRSPGQLLVSNVKWRSCTSFPNEGRDVTLGKGWTDNGDSTYSYDGNGEGTLAFPGIAGDAATWDIYEFKANVKTVTIRGAGWTGFGPMLYNTGKGEIYFRTQDGSGCYVMYTQAGNAENQVPGTPMLGAPAQSAGTVYPVRIIVQKSTRRVQYYFADELLADFKLPDITGLLENGAPLADAVAAIKVRSPGQLLVSDVSWNKLDLFPGEGGDYICGVGWKVAEDGTITYNGNGGSIYYNKLTDEEKNWPVYEMSADVTVEEEGAAGWVGWGPMLVNNPNGTSHFRTQWGGGGYLMYTPAGGTELDVGMGNFNTAAQAAGETYNIRLVVNRVKHRVSYYFNDVLCFDSNVDTFGGLINAEDPMEMVIGFNVSSAPKLTIRNLTWKQGSEVAEAIPGEYENPLEEEPIEMERWFAQLGEREEEPRPTVPETTQPNQNVTQPSQENSNVPGGETDLTEDTGETEPSITNPTDSPVMEDEDVVVIINKRRKKATGLSAGALAGIIGGSAAGAVILGTVIALLIYKKKTGHWPAFLLRLFKRKKANIDGGEG